MLEALHLAALIPAFALIVKGPERLPSSYLLLAMAWAVSWIGDSLAWALDGSWAAFYVWVPIQVGLALIAFTEHRVAVVGALGALAIISTATFPGPEILVTTLGGSALVLLVRGPLAWPVYFYFGYGTLLYLMMVSGGFDMTYWYGYQACRLGAYALFVALVFRRHPWAPS